jgi:shikimate kinase
LRAQVDTLARRVGSGAGRPLLDGDPLTALADLEAVRRPLYAEVADLIIDVDGLPPPAVAARVLEAVAQ